MARRKIDGMNGQVFGQLTVVGDGPRHPKRNGRQFYCRCKCGAMALVYITALTSGNTKSCGKRACKRITLAEGRALNQTAKVTPRDVAIQTLRDAGGYGGRNNRLTAREVRFLRAAGYLARRRAA